MQMENGVGLFDLTQAEMRPRCGIGESGRPREPHKLEIAGSNPAPAISSVWANMHGGLHSKLKAEDAGSSPAVFIGLWESWSLRSPVTGEIAGSSPVSPVDT